jgi:hypothetical protein
MSRLSTARRPAVLLLAALGCLLALASCAEPEGVELLVHNVSGRPAVVAIHEGTGPEAELMDLEIVGQQTVPAGEEEHFYLPMPDEWTVSIDGHLVYDSTQEAAANGALAIRVGSGATYDVRPLEETSSSSAAPSPGG